LVFDPNGVSSSFQTSFALLSEDSVFVADTLDDSIFDFDGLFLFIEYPFILSQNESEQLIQYTSENKPVYLFSGLYFQGLDTLAFWNHIGVNEIQGLLIAVMVDSVAGIDSTFTNEVLIDTSFTSWSVPIVTGSVMPILSAWWSGSDFYTTYISGYDSLSVIIDLYNLIDDTELLRRVLVYFELQPPNHVNEEIISLYDFALFQNYPNPFNPSTTINYSVPELSNVVIKVFDILGNEIETLVNDEKPAGIYEITWYADNLPSGIYFYRLQVYAPGRAGSPSTSSGQSFVETKKMVLLR
jgi:hypothetical protein